VPQAHAIAWWIEIEALARDWPRVRQLEDRLRQPIHANIATQQVSVIRALLLCAAARAHLADATRATVLEHLANDLAHGPDDRLAAPHIRLALAQDDLEGVATLMAVTPHEWRPWATWWALDLEVTRLDALTALHDAAGVEAEAPKMLGSGDFINAIAKRALGAVRRDPKLLHEATDAFTRMTLPRHVEQTITLADLL